MGKMIIPKKVKVGGLIFTVDIVESLDTDGAAVTNSKTNSIRIERATQEAMEATFWHELIHAINHEYSEIDAEFLGRALYQLVKDNKEIFK